MDDELLHNVNDGSAALVQPSMGYDVFEWKPTQDGTGDATAVCLVFSMKIGDVELRPMIRLKSRRAVNEMIAALEKHRDGVWPQG